MIASWQESYDKPRQYIKKQGHYLADTGLYSQGYGLSSSQIRMWELYHKEGRALKNWCFHSGAGEGSWEFPGQQGDQTSQS